MGDLPGTPDTVLSTGDVSIYDPDRTNGVTVTQDPDDPTVYRLDVNSKIVGGSFQLQQFNPVVVADPTGVSLSTGAWTTIVSVTSTEGKLDFIGAAGSGSNYRIRVTIDATEVFDLTMAELNAIGLSNDVGVPLRVETADKNFRLNPASAWDFGDSLLIEAQSTSATPTLTSVVIYREVT